jgi:hypothetical protein
VLALLFELFGVAVLMLAVIHFSWHDILSIVIITSALARTLPTILRRLRDAWQAPSLAAGS